MEPEANSLAQKHFGIAKFADMLNDAYMADQRAPYDKPKKSFAPSGVGYGPGMCPRRWYYDFRGGIMREDSVDPIGIANMAYGTDAHARLQKVFEKTGKLVEAERKVISEDPPIYGFADLVIKWQGEESVGEIKTTSQESYVSKSAKNKGAGYHLLQVLIYMKVLGLNQGFLLYENKNNQELLLIPVTWNAENIKLVDNTFEWMRTVYANAKDENGELPKRGFTRKSIACKACPFFTHCWENSPVGTLPLPNLEVPK